MATESGNLNKAELERYSKCPVRCRRIPKRIQGLADYFSVFSSVIKKDGPFWFRGHGQVDWTLTPSALRYKRRSDREKALALLSDFKRVAEMKLSRPPRSDQELMWVQIARHYGLPTRLLDWTENAAVALFFACERIGRDGMVFVLNPIDLNRLSYRKKSSILDPNLDSDEITKYLRMGAARSPSGRNPIAINPVWNNERLVLQKGVFTLHGPRFELDGEVVPSLVALPILREAKPGLLAELERVGVDEMTIFPELEHSCRHMRRKAGLEIQE
jgi:hypothetical protein